MGWLYRYFKYIYYICYVRLYGDKDINTLMSNLNNELSIAQLNLTLNNKTNIAENHVKAINQIKEYLNNNIDYDYVRAKDISINNWFMVDISESKYKFFYMLVKLKNTTNNLDRVKKGHYYRFLLKKYYEYLEMVRIMNRICEL